MKADYNYGVYAVEYFVLGMDPKQTGTAAQPECVELWSIPLANQFSNGLTLH